MGRVKPAYVYARKLKIAEDREAYLKANPPKPPVGPIQSRGATTSLYYRSMALTDGTNPLIFDVNVPSAYLTELSAIQLGLLDTLGTGDISLRLRGSGVKPTRVHWYEGIATPTRDDTPWGSSVAKYYNDEIHSAPFSQRTGAFTAANLRENFIDLFQVGGPARGLLGAKNGRAWLELERAPISVMT